MLTKKALAAAIAAIISGAAIADTEYITNADSLTGECQMPLDTTWDSGLFASFSAADIPHPNCMDPHPYDAQAGIVLNVEDSNIDGDETIGPEWEFEIIDEACDGDVPAAFSDCPAE